MNQARADPRSHRSREWSVGLTGLRRPRYAVAKEADVDGAFALVLLASGQEQTAFEKIDKALKYPDRRGVISTTAAQSQGSHTLLRAVSRWMLSERRHEKVASQGWWKRIQHWWASWFGEPEYEVDANDGSNDLARQRLSDFDRQTLLGQRTYWRSILVGSGTSLDFGGRRGVCCSRRGFGGIDSFEGVEGYYALEAEIAYERGDWSDVLTFATLPKSSCWWKSV